MKHSWIVVLAALLQAAPAVASAPAIVNYQGVLLNAGGMPESGPRDMIFRFYDAPVGGGEILRLRHTQASFAPVSVSAGLFNVPLGSGPVEDGAFAFSNDPYDSLAKAFRDFDAIYLQVEIRTGPAGGTGAFEILSPRTRLVSAPWALEAAQLGGRSASGFLDTTTTPQIKPGDLTVADLTAAGNDIRFGSAGVRITASPSMLTLGSGTGQVQIWNDTTGLPTASFTSGGLELEGYLAAASAVNVGGATLTSFSTHLSITGGPDASDELWLRGGDAGFGSIQIAGQGTLSLHSGNGSFQFVNGSVAGVTALLDGSGNLQTFGDVTVMGNDLRFADPGPVVWGTFSSLSARAGLDDTDDLFLGAGNSIDDGRIWILGDSSVEVAAGSGVINFHNGALAQQTAQLQGDGDLLIGGALFQNQFDLAEAYLAGEPLEPGDVVRLHPDRVGAVMKTGGDGDETVIGVVSGRPGVVLGGTPLSLDRLRRMWGPEITRRFLEQRERLVADALALQPEIRERLDRLERETAGSPGPRPGDSESDAPSQRRELLAGIEATALESFYWRHFVPIALAGRLPVKVDGRFGDIAAGDRLAPGPIPGVARRSDGSGPTIGIALESFSGERGFVEVFITRGQGTASSGPGAAGTMKVTTPGPQESVEPRREPTGAHAVDLAEVFPISEAALPGDVLAADPGSPGRFRPARFAYDATVIGVVVLKPGVAPRPEASLTDDGGADDADAPAGLSAGFDPSAVPGAAVALCGSVMVNVDAGYGSIRAGDLLATSETPGHARRSDEAAPGTVLGKALESLESGTGRIRMLVMMR